MNDDRRTFLKSTAAGVIAGGILAGKAGEALAQDKTPAAAAKGSNQMTPAPKNMTFTMLDGPDGLSLGVRTDKGIVDVGAAAAAFKIDAPTTTDDIISGDYDAAALKTAVDKATAAGGKYLVAENAAKFGPVVTAPSKIICVGLNYRSHANEAAMKIPFEPILFNKYNSALNAHNGTIAVSKEAGHQFDYETELVAIIGKEARNVSEADALKYVFGYTVGHDFSERDQQLRDGQWMLGKTGDGWGPIGPWLVTADQIDPDNLNLKTLVNGEQRQNANTKDMIFSTAKIVAFASKYMTLEPGDVIFTGTPEGVILGYPKDKQVWLKAGDKIVSSIDKIGELHFTLT
ncbi:MAG: fumarylacetoacetate hydrolase family protein [Xanthobacteraceae bacterium]|nr:fumarylacetoacetate hydrolase family protein [Xanthobacteraceae bacterium]